jgi:ribosomal-protein-serine acetyltransferase
MFSHRIDDKIKLSLPEMDRAEELAQVVQKNLAHLQPWMPWAVDDYSEVSAKEWIQRTLSEFAEDGRFNAVIMVDEKMIGAIGFHNLSTAHGSAEIGYWIDKSYEGQGIISRCSKALIDYLFNVRGLNRIQINCNVENVRSRAVPERLGFKLEGVHRQVEKVQGKFGDWAVYAMLRDEWAQKNKAR